MKKILLLLIAILIVSYSCKDDDEITDAQQIEYTAEGLQVDILPIVNDTIIRNSNMIIEIVNGNLDNIDPNQVYELNLQGENFNNVKIGTTIIDNIDGRLWVVKEINSNKQNKNDIINVLAFVGGLGNLFQNSIFKYSSGSNRAKENSNYPNKLPSYEATLISANNEQSWNINSESIYNPLLLPAVVDGIDAQIDQFGNIILEFDNFSFSENFNSLIPLEIDSGVIEINNAVDVDLMFNPSDALLAITNPLSFNTGLVKYAKTAIYTETNMDVQIAAEINTSDINEPFEVSGKVLDQFVAVPISPYAFIVFRLEGILKSSLEASVTFNIAPRYVSNDDFVTLINFESGGLPNLDFEHNNIDSYLVEGESFPNFESEIKLEFITKASILFYGLIGPSGEISPYVSVDGRVYYDNSTNTYPWDIGIDFGIDTKIALSTIFWKSSDVLINEGLPTVDLLESEHDDVLNKNIFKTPAITEVLNGNFQTGVTNTPLNNEIEVIVKSSVGYHRSLVPVYFETTNGNGEFNSNTVITDSEGKATNIWTLGVNPNEQTAHIYVKDGNGNIIPETEQIITAYVESSNNIPTVNTASVTVTSDSSATSGGTIVDNGGSEIVSKGVCWSTSNNPTINDSHTNDGSGSTAFGSTIEGLTANTTYYVKAYATNSEGTGYGEELEFTTSQPESLDLYTNQGVVFETNISFANPTFSQDGLNMFSIYDDKVAHFNLNSKYNLNNIDDPDEILETIANGSSRVAKDVVINSDGTILYVKVKYVNFGSDLLLQYNLTTPYSLDTAVLVDQIEVFYAYNYLNISYDDSTIYLMRNYAANQGVQVYGYRFGTNDAISSISVNSEYTSPWIGYPNSFLPYSISKSGNSVLQSPIVGSSRVLKRYLVSESWKLSTMSLNVDSELTHSFSDNAIVEFYDDIDQIIFVSSYEGNTFRLYRYGI